MSSLILNLKRKRDEPPTPENSEPPSNQIGTTTAMLSAHLPYTNLNVIMQNNDQSAPISDEEKFENTNKKCKTESENENLDFLMEALKKVQELENEMANYSDDTDDDSDDGIDVDDAFERNALAFEAEALGFAACARETLTFLAGEGLGPEDPLIKTLRNRLVGKCQGIPY